MSSQVFHSVSDWLHALLGESAERREQRLRHREDAELRRERRERCLLLAEARRHVRVRDVSLDEGDSCLMVMVDGTPVFRVAGEDSMAAGTVALANVAAVLARLRESYADSHPVRMGNRAAMY